MTSQCTWAQSRKTLGIVGSARLPVNTSAWMLRFSNRTSTVLGWMPTLCARGTMRGECVVSMFNRMKSECCEAEV